MLTATGSGKSFESFRDLWKLAHTAVDQLQLTSLEACVLNLVLSWLTSASHHLRPKRPTDAMHEAMKHELRRARRWLAHQRLDSPRVLFLVVLGLGAMTFMGFRQDLAPSTRGPTQQLVLNEGRTSRALLAVTPSHQHLRTLPHAPTQQHSFIVLDGDAFGSAASRELQAQLAPFQQHPDAITITSLTGAAAVSIAAQFLVPTTSLPAVVYLPPMWESGGAFKQSAVFIPKEDPLGAAGFNLWVKGHARMTMLLLNDWDKAELCFYFLNEAENKEVELGCPETQTELWQEVGLLDQFTARNKTNQAVLARHVALYSGLFVVRPPGACQYLIDRSCTLEKPPQPQDAEVLAFRKESHELRRKAMIDQPKEFHHYTKVGFHQRRAPVELFQALSGYLNASWDNVAREMWLDEDIFTNHFEAPSLKVTLPEIGPLKPRLFGVVQQLLEAWIGGQTPLESTAMYGIRLYTRNNTLSMHCDRPDTHIVSAILNVAQDVEEPWPLQIKDHAGNEHSVVMQPGDMVMYEGATCAHGRELPLKGRYFANVFVHFKPKGGVARVSPQQ